MAPNRLKISTTLARKLILHAQLLDGHTELPDKKAGIARTIQKLGYIQIDTISVINRSHHHTLWTRRNDYDREMLQELQSKDRLVFEYWAHAMSILPIEDYRYFIPKMQNFRHPTSAWAKYLLEKCGHLFQLILERIRDEGPLSSKDFSAPKNEKGGTWWDWKPAKAALEFLFWRGDLMITERRNFQKLYDMTERVLPAHIDRTMPTDDELGRHHVRRALASLGIAGEKAILSFMQPASARDADIQTAGKDLIKKSIDALLDEKELMPVMLEQDPDSLYYGLSGILEDFKTSGRIRPRVCLLSPFDNFIIQRDRIKRLFDFDYALECYVPVAKRKFGYFVLPILWNERFVGRLDPKADRAKKRLIIRNLVFEPEFNAFEDFIPLFSEKVIDLARFNECERIKVEKVTPHKIREPIVSSLKRQAR